MLELPSNTKHVSNACHSHGTSESMIRQHISSNTLRLLLCCVHLSVIGLLLNLLQFVNVSMLEILFRYLIRSLILISLNV